MRCATPIKNQICLGIVRNIIIFIQGFRVQRQLFFSVLSVYL